MKPILNLTIKRKWLDMIVSGEKREEYRAPSCPQLRTTGLYKQMSCARNELRALYRAGYRMDSPAALVEVVAVISPLPKTTPIHPEWGEPELPHWTIVLGAVLETGTYAEIKARLETIRKTTERHK